MFHTVCNILTLLLFQKKMNIILTRPLIEIEDLMNVLFKQGHNLIHLPTLKIKPVEISPINFKNFDAIIFTSSNAVRNLKI